METEKQKMSETFEKFQNKLRFSRRKDEIELHQQRVSHIPG